jgi:nucleoid DNA-binding protein
MFSFWKNESAAISVIFNISSGVVSGALVKHAKDGVPKILYTVETPIRKNASLSSSEYLKETMRSLRGTIISITRHGTLHLNFSGDHKLPRKYYCYLAAPWVATETRTLNINAKNTKFTKEFLDKLIQQEVIEFEQRSELSNNTHGVELIERKVLDIRINGYSTQNPYGKILNQASLDVFLGIAPTDFLKEITTTIETAIGRHTKITFGSFSAVASTMIDQLFDNSNFSILDVTGEISDVTLIENNLFLESISIPLAKNELIRKIAKKFATTNHEATSIIKMYVDNSLSVQIKGELEVVLEVYGEDFIKTLNNIISTPLKGKVYLISDKEVETLFKNWLLKLPSVTPVLLDNKIFSNKIKGVGVNNPLVILESLYTDWLLGLR